MSRSWMGGVTPMTEEEIKENMNPWWKKTITGVVIGVAAVATILVAVYVTFEILSFKSGKAEQQADEPESAE